VLAMPLEDLSERFKETLIFFREAYGYTQMIRHAVVSDRAHDHPLA
jgi:hypothetical protein